MKKDVFNSNKSGFHGYMLQNYTMSANQVPTEYSRQ